MPDGPGPLAGSGPAGPQPSGLESPQPSGLESLCDSVLRLLQAAPRQPARVRLAAGSTSVEIEWATGPATAPAADPAEPEGDATGTIAAAPGVFPITAPMVGTFYHAPEPGAPPFVEVGDVIEAGQTVGILEAMKLMNPIEAQRAGRVIEIAVDNAAPVEFDQPLIVCVPLHED